MRIPFFKALLMFLILVAIESCSCEDNIPDQNIAAGKVLNYDGQGIEGVTIEVIHLNDNMQGKTDAEGRFEISVPRSKSYVINITKKGFGFRSVVYQDSLELDSIPYNEYYLNQATVATIDASIGGTVTVTNTESLGSSSSRADWSQSPTGKLPLVLDDSGRVASFIMPEKLKSAWDIQSQNKARLPRASLRIAGNSLVNKSGAPAQGNISVSISATDMFSPNGMPGNNIATTNRGQTGPMQSFGAVSIEVYDDDQSYNLDQESKATAEVIIPVPDWQLELRKENRDAIPLLYYNESNGVWEENGQAIFDDSLKAYRAQLTHFSSINFDIIKTDPSSSLSFSFQNTTPMPAANELILPFRVELTTEDAADNMLYVRTRTIDAINGGNPLCEISSAPIPGGTLTTYGISMNRLPPLSPVAVVFFNDVINPVAQSLYVLQTGPGDQTITDDPWNVPSCMDITNEVFSDITSINTDIYATANPTDPVLVAMCLNAAGTHYRVSLASRDLTFDALDPTTGININFIDVEQFPGDPFCGSSYQELWNAATPFVELFKTQVGPPENPEWLVQVLEVPVTS
ncbi:carboxypeptidase-like regulatory domain-containing protein, partial [Reichenbachiella sp.]